MKKELTQRVKEYLIANCNEKKKAIGMEDLASIMETSTRRIRLSVRELRRENPFGKKKFLVSDLEIGGYWITEKKEEIEQWLRGYLSSALDALTTAQKARKIVKYKLPIEEDNVQQLSLFES